MICSRLTPGRFVRWSVCKNKITTRRTKKNGIYVKKMWRLTGEINSRLLDHNRSDILIRMNKAAKTKIKKKRAKVKADADAADESGAYGLEQSEKDIEDAPSDAEEPKKKKEKKRFGFFNRHS